MNFIAWYRVHPETLTVGHKVTLWNQEVHCHGHTPYNESVCEIHIHILFSITESPKHYWRLLNELKIGGLRFVENNWRCGACGCQQMLSLILDQQLLSELQAIKSLYTHVPAHACTHTHETCTQTQKYLSQNTQVRVYLNYIGIWKNWFWRWDLNWTDIWEDQMVYFYENGYELLDCVKTENVLTPWRTSCSMEFVMLELKTRLQNKAFWRVWQLLSSRCHAWILDHVSGMKLEERLLCLRLHHYFFHVTCDI
jgi:hypothetical protein